MIETCFKTRYCLHPRLWLLLHRIFFPESCFDKPPEQLANQKLFCGLKCKQEQELSNRREENLNFSESPDNSWKLSQVSVVALQLRYIFKVVVSNNQFKMLHGNCFQNNKDAFVERSKTKQMIRTFS